jgi:hypothetical protein
MVYIKILAIIAVIVSIAWFIVEPGYDSGITSIASISALIGAFIVEKRKIRRIQQSQHVSNPSVGMQCLALTGCLSFVTNIEKNK